MASSYIFFNNQLLHEVTLTNPGRFQIPIGSYIFSENLHWYFKSNVSLIPINYCDIPKEIRTLCLIMGISA